MSKQQPQKDYFFSYFGNKAKKSNLNKKRRPAKNSNFGIVAVLSLLIISGVITGFFVGQAQKAAIASASENLESAVEVQQQDAQ